MNGDDFNGDEKEEKDENDDDDDLERVEKDRLEFTELMNVMVRRRELHADGNDAIFLCVSDTEDRSSDQSIVY